jgi:hypothetical protein
MYMWLLISYVTYGLIEVHFPQVIYITCSAIKARRGTSAEAGKMLVSLEKLVRIIYKKQTRLPRVYGGQDLKQAKRIL